MRDVGGYSSTRNSLTFVKTIAIEYGQNLEALGNSFPITVMQ